MSNEAPARREEAGTGEWLLAVAAIVLVFLAFRYDPEVIPLALLLALAVPQAAQARRWGAGAIGRGPRS